MILHISLTDYSNQKLVSYIVDINCSWVKVTTRIDGINTVVYKREPDNDTWYDEGHKHVVDALRDLEKALLNVIPRN